MNIMSNRLHRTARRILSCLLLTAVFLPAAPQSSAQSDVPWYQVEVSIFARQNANLTQERWDLQAERAREAGLGQNADMRLTSLADVLSLSDWSVLNPQSGAMTASEATRAASAARRQQSQDGDGSGNQALDARMTPGADSVQEADTGPAPDPRAPLIAPQAFNPDDISLPDYARDAFVRLPAGEQNFRDTNRALENSPDYRLLWHAAWRQPMRQAAQTERIAVSGGRDLPPSRSEPRNARVRLLGDAATPQDAGVSANPQSAREGESVPEMRGTLRAYFSPDQTRVILDAELWLSVFDGGERLELPMQQSRPMRSNEFHYLDHPAMGILVEVFRYERPAPPLRSLPLPGDQPDGLPGT